MKRLCPIIFICRLILRREHLLNIPHYTLVTAVPLAATIRIEPFTVS